MAIIKYKNVAISAISACVPKTVSSNHELRSMMPEEEVEKVINSIGIKEKRIADKDVCASDLCFKAAEKLLEDNNIDRDSIDVLLFLSQLPDYKIPATAPVLQNRLCFPKTTAALDLSLGCSGYVYGLATAMSFASQEGINRVLLLVGETFSKIVNKQDKVNAPLYGDAGTATLIEKGKGNEVIFSLYSDGAGKDAVMIKTGGSRFPDTVESIIPREKEEGNIRADNEVFMDGMDVFNFALSVVPKSIKEICTIAHADIMNVEHIILHQANKFMTDFIVKRLKYPVEKIPYCLDRYGNTSSASIPLTIASELSGKNIGNVVMCGFGAGLSWGSAYLSLAQCNISKVIDY
ncbi:MAG: ketoacyl-ACP synthase III [Tannerella sp.]|jgi:3-oxoacyl-[acyl-carrier-protein] synthase-3|nr:ketoacyl-ACP synthase III [Tannerella sp.]